MIKGFDRLNVYLVPIPEPRTEEPGARWVRMQGAATQ